MPIKKWNCQRCNRGYASFEAAEQCEQQHAQPGAILGADHKSHFQTDDGIRWPKTLIVGFNNAPEGVYQFKGPYVAKPRPDAGRGTPRKPHVLSCEPVPSGDTASGGPVGI